MVTLTVGHNSYGTLAEADAHLDASIRAAATWVATAPDTKKRALVSAYRKIENETWQGAAAGVNVIDTAVVAAGGTGYAVDDLLTVGGGTSGETPIVKVLTAPGGVVGTVEIVNAGTYSVDPTSPASTTGGGGTGCTLTLTLAAQTSDHPRSGLTDCDGLAVDATTYAPDLKAGQFELAYEMVLDPELELSSGTGTNVKSVKAGSAKVDFFRPEENTQSLPTVVHDLIGCFFAAAAGAKFGFVSGTDGESCFTEGEDEYGLTGGL